MPAYDPTQKLFALLKAAIPELPDSVTRLSLVLDIDSAPVISYNALVTDVTDAVPVEQTFIITGMKPAKA